MPLAHLLFVSQKKQCVHIFSVLSPANCFITVTLFSSHKQSFCKQQPFVLIIRHNPLGSNESTQTLFRDEPPHKGYEVYKLKDRQFHTLHFTFCKKNLSRMLFHGRFVRVLISVLLRLELVAIWDLVNKQIQIKAVTVCYNIYNIYTYIHNIYIHIYI